MSLWGRRHLYSSQGDKKQQRHPSQQQEGNFSQTCERGKLKIRTKQGGIKPSQQGGREVSTQGWWPPPFNHTLFSLLNTVPSSGYRVVFPYWHFFFSSNKWHSICTDYRNFAKFTQNEFACNFLKNTPNVFMDLALYTGGQSSWKRKEPSPDWCHKLEGRESRSLYDVLSVETPELNHFGGVSTYLWSTLEKNNWQFLFCFRGSFYNHLKCN